MGPEQGALLRRPVPQAQALETQSCNWSLCRARFPYSHTTPTGSNMTVVGAERAENHSLSWKRSSGEPQVRRRDHNKANLEPVTRTARAQVRHSLTSTESTTHAPRKAHLLSSQSPTLHVAFNKYCKAWRKRKK